MGWLQVRMEASGTDPGPLEDALLATGAIAVTMDDAGDDPIYEPGPGELPLWPTTRITGLYPGSTNSDVLRAALVNAVAPEALPPHEFLLLDDRTWEREWLKDFRPMRFGTRLWVIPGQYTPPHADAVNLLLDPGLAFGTGTHATTALCLEWLDAAADLKGARVVDYGCGSGILAVAAALLGAREVLAVDNDPQALVATRVNAERNGVADRIRTFLPADAPNAWDADLLVANILAAPLIQLAARFDALTQPSARMAVSGLIARQVEEVRAAYSPWCPLEELVEMDGWVRLAGAKG